jgi:hypothetical protein
MLSDSLILHLLARCEQGIGELLNQVRGNLGSREWLGAVWELIVIDAALRIGHVSYEANVPSPGSGAPDLLLEFGNSRIWIEAAFLRTLHSAPPETLHQQPVFLALKEKARKASRARTTEPYVVFLATDRVHEIDAHSPQIGLRADDAVRAVFTSSTSLSAVVLIPVLIRAETFVGLDRRARPRLLLNPAARTALSEAEIGLINRFDFNRWRFTTNTQPDVLRRSLRNFLKACRGREVVPLPVDPSSIPSDNDSWPSPCWAYVSRFRQLRIVQFGKGYALLNGRVLEFQAETAEQAAETASSLFRPLSPYVIGPNGIQLDPDSGVPADLRRWILEIPPKASKG